MAGFCGAGGCGDVATDSLWAATGDIAVATADDAATVLTVGGSLAVLNIECGTPAWTTTPTLAGLTATGDITTTGADIDWDLRDNRSSALSFDSGCQVGILALVTTNCSEGVTMSGTLGVTGVLTATGGIELSHASQNTLTASSGLLSIESKVVYSACGTDVPVADGGTGLSCLTTGSVLIGTGSSDVTLVDMATKGDILIGDGTTAPRVLDVGSNCKVLTACSGEDTGVKWACAAGGGAVSAINNATANELVTIGATTTELCAESGLTFASGNLTVTDGNLIFGTNNNGIDFSNNTCDGTASCISSELLDDYEEGTWTPVLGDNNLSSGGECSAYAAASGDYVKIGRHVFFTFRMIMSSLGNLTTCQHARILGLPFTERGSAGVDGAQIIINPQANGGLNITAGHSVSGSVTAANARMNLQVWDATTGNTSMLISEISADGALSGSGSYLGLT